MMKILYRKGFKMGDTLVVYASKYGYTEKYAEWIAEELNADVLRTNQVKNQDLKKYSTIVFGGGLYAGSVNGIDVIVKNIESIRDKKVIIFTCGVAKPDNPENVHAIKAGIEKKLEKIKFYDFKIYNLQGGMDFEKLNFIDKTMIKVFIKMLKKKDSASLREEDKELIKNFESKTNYCSKESIIPILEEVRK